MPIAFPAPGSVVAGRYVLEGVLGAGRSGTVYGAAQPALAREVAIKVVPAASAQRLGYEAVAAARVRHPGSVAIHDTGLAPGGDAYLVMDRIHGTSLAQLLDEGPLPLPRALAIADQLLDVLDAAHEAGVAHGDLTSVNILVEDSDRIIVIDYGHARCDADASDIAIGADIRAAGMVLRELLTSGAEIAVPPALDYAVKRALEPDPQRRFPSAQAMRRSLRTIDAARLPGSTGALRGLPRPGRRDAARSASAAAAEVFSAPPATAVR